MFQKIGFDEKVVCHLKLCSDIIDDSCLLVPSLLVPSLLVPSLLVPSLLVPSLLVPSLLVLPVSSSSSKLQQDSSYPANNLILSWKFLFQQTWSACCPSIWAIQRENSRTLKSNKMSRIVYTWCNELDCEYLGNE